MEYRRRNGKVFVLLPDTQRSNIQQGKAEQGDQPDQASGDEQPQPEVGIRSDQHSVRLVGSAPIRDPR